MLLFKATVYIRGYTHNQSGTNEALKFLRKEFADNFGGCTEISTRETFSDPTPVFKKGQSNKEVTMTVFLRWNEWGKFKELCRVSKTYTLKEDVFVTGLFGITRIL